MAKTPAKSRLDQIMETPKAPRVSLAQYVRNVRSEMRKVVWPTGKETRITTLMVLLMVVLAATFFFLVDQVLSYGIRLILG